MPEGSVAPSSKGRETPGASSGGPASDGTRSGATLVPDGTAAPAPGEMDELRAELSTLRARNEELERTRGRRVFSLAAGSTGRRVLSTVLVLLAVILTPVSVLAVWAKNTLTDTNQYVATVAPLASDPAVQSAVATRLTDRIIQNVDTAGLVHRVLPQDQSQLAGPLTAAIDRFIGAAVSRVVHSPQFATVWTEANRVAHTQLVGALEGTSTGGLSVTSGEVRLNLATLVTTVKQQLSDAGLSAVDSIPTGRIDATFTVFKSTAVTRVQWGFNALRTMGDWMPVVVLAILLLGLWLSRDRRRALIGAAIGVTFVMLLFGGALLLARGYYVDHLPASVSHPAVSAALDIILRFLRQAFWGMVALGLVVACAAFVAGPSPVAKGVRHLAGTGMGHLGDRAERAGALPGAVRTFVGRSRRLFEGGVVAAAVVVLILWQNRTVAVVLGTAAVTVVVLLLVQVLGRRTAQRVASGAKGGDRVAPGEIPQHPPAGGGGFGGRTAA